MSADTVTTGSGDSHGVLSPVTPPVHVTPPQLQLWVLAVSVTGHGDKCQAGDRSSLRAGEGYVGEQDHLLVADLPVVEKRGTPLKRTQIWVPTNSTKGPTYNVCVTIAGVYIYVYTCRRLQ